MKLQVTRLVARLSEDDRVMPYGEPITVNFTGYANLFRKVTSAHRGTDLKDWGIILPEYPILPFDVISVAHGIPSPLPLVR